MSALSLEDVAVDVQPHFWSKKQPILRGVTLEVAAGEVFGFLGPNGAGKTTTMRAVLGLMKRRKGKIEVLGGDIASPEVRRRLGFMPEHAYFPEHLSGREVLIQHGLLTGLPLDEVRTRAADILERVGLTAAATRRLRTYSKGMLQRVGFAQAVIGDPDLVLLDEPLSGLDPLGRRDIRELIAELKERGKTVFFSTHILPDVEMVCDRVGILVAGEIKRVGPLAELLGETVAGVEVIAEASPDAVQAARPSAQAVDTHGAVTVFRAADTASANTLIDRLREGGARIRDVHTLRGTLEDLFVSTTATEAEP